MLVWPIQHQAAEKPGLCLSLAALWGSISNVCATQPALLSGIWPYIMLLGDFLGFWMFLDVSKGCLCTFI